MGGGHTHHFQAPAPATGPLHRLPAGLKLGVALGLILVVVALPPPAWGWLAGVVLLLLAVASVGRVLGWHLLKRLLWLEPFVFGVALLILFQPDGGHKFVLALVRTNLCLFTTLLLSQTTSFTELLRVLQKMRVPWLLVTTLTLMHRYLFVLTDESARLRRARAARTFTPHRRFEWRSLATVIGHLFVRASGRAERIYNAMCARGWK